MAEEIVLIYETVQVDDVIAYQKEHPSAKIISLDFWTERLLHERGIAFESLSVYCPPYEDLGDLRKRTGDIAREWYRFPECTFYTHDDIRLGEAHEPAVDMYLQHALYYLFALKRIVEANAQYSTLVVPHSTHPVPPTAGPLMVFEGRIIPDTARFLAETKDMSIEHIGTTGKIYGAEPFPPQSKLKVFLLRLYNAFISLVAPRKPIKIFASEYWWHVAPFMEKMNDVEIVMMDRSESKSVPWRQLWKHRMRFMHPLDEADERMRRIARERREYFAKEWIVAKEAVAHMPEFEYEGIDWWPLVEQGFDFLVNIYSERVVADSEAFKKIFKREKINKVLLRASMSLHQHHFYIAAQVAKSLGIPSIELQHAGAVMDPRDAQSRLRASYLAAYGKLTREFQVNNYDLAPERVRPIGSPRFDRYLEGRQKLSADDRKKRIEAIGLDSNKPIILFGVPSEFTTLGINHFTSFEVVSSFDRLREVQKSLPDLQIIFKFRPRSLTQLHRDYIRELFSYGGFFIAEYEDLFAMIELSDVVISSNSTLIYEAMLADMPVVLFPWKQNDPHLDVYKMGGISLLNFEALLSVLRYLLTDQSFYEESKEKGQKFLSENYSFDGRASERMVALLHEQLPV